MTQVRKSHLTIGLILACTCGLSLCAQADEAKIDLKFEINNEEPQLWIGDGLKNPGRGPIKPTHVATFHIRQPIYYDRFPRNPEGTLQILKSSAGKSLSEQQRKFLTASDAILWRGLENIRNHDTVLLYAVSADDAKKMVQAFLEIAVSKANAEVQYYRTRLQESKEKAAKTKEVLLQIETELKARSLEYGTAKSKTHRISSDEEAAKESKETVQEMNRVLDSLAIEITGIEAKLSAVERLTSQGKIRSVEGLAKLEEIRSEQTVELAGALARKKAATDIREREEEFYGKYRRWTSFANRVEDLKAGLSNAEENQRDCEEKLANPVPEMLPPQLYQNKVTIHPIKAE